MIYRLPCFEELCLPAALTWKTGILVQMKVVKETKIHYKLENISAKINVSVQKAEELLPDYDLKHICRVITDSERESV